MFKKLGAFPSLLLAVIAYAAIVQVWSVGKLDSSPLKPVTLPSGDVISLTVAGMLIVGSLFLLFIEILQATSRGQIKWINQSLSTLVLLLAAVLWFVVPDFGTETFLIIACMTLVDVMAAPAIRVFPVMFPSAGPGMDGT